MSGIDNRTLIQKADLALSDLTTGGGILNPVQAEQFMRLLIKQSVLMRMATVVPMKAPKMNVPKIKFGSRVLRPGAEGTAVSAGNRVKPDLSYVDLDAKLFKAEVRLTDEQLEDNIEQGTFKETIIQLLSEAVARDMEDVVINGDTTSGDTTLAVLDGVLKKATTNVVDLGAGGVNISSTVFKTMLKTMPAEYLRDRTRLKYLASVDGEITYRDSLGARATAAGDKNLLENAPTLYAGVAVEPIPLFPENLGGTTDRTIALLLDPKNIYVGIWRQIRIEQWRDVSEGVTKICASLRFDVELADEPAVVKAINIKLA